MWTGNDNFVALASAGALFLLTMIKLASGVMRSWNGDRKEDKADKSTGNQIDVLERENKLLREENKQLRDDWQRMVRAEAELSACIKNLENQVQEQNAKINLMSKLVAHLIKSQENSAAIPTDILNAMLGVDNENIFTKE